MIRILLYIITGLSLLCSCNKEEDYMIPGEYNNELGLLEEEIIFPPEGGTRYITTDTQEERQWRLSSICDEKYNSLTISEALPEKLEYDWMKVFRTGEKSISVTVAENAQSKDRTLIIEFNMGDFYPHLTVVQRGKQKLTDN